MDYLDRVFKAIAIERAHGTTLIACLYTGVQFPQAGTPMPRDPAPSTGQLIRDLAVALDEALTANEAIHDGAIMIGRHTCQDDYQVTGWSFRLFPSATVNMSIVNRGSAFYSCLAMSSEADVDTVYLVSGRRTYRFQAGCVAEL